MQKTRNPWTEDDVALLLSVYESRGDGPLVFPPELLARHSRSSCNTTAHLRGFTNTMRPRAFPELMLLNAVDVGYLAGIIDGEGHVSQTKSVITVASTTPCITDWLLAHVPGSHLASPRLRENPKHNTVHRWEITNHLTAQNVAAQIHPYVLIPYKKRRLEVMAFGADRQIGPLAPDLSPSDAARGVPGHRYKSECVNGHDISGLRLGQNCPGCAAIWKDRMKAKGLAVANFMVTHVYSG